MRPALCSALFVLLASIASVTAQQENATTAGEADSDDYGAIAPSPGGLTRPAVARSESVPDEQGGSKDGEDELVPVATVELNSTQFEPLTRKGLWFIKYYSPFCAFCVIFKPVWEEVAVNKSAVYGEQVHFGNVNCVAFGDLCKDIRMRNGAKFDVYPKSGNRDFPSLSAYVDETTSKAYNGLDSFKPAVPVNPLGMSVVFGKDNFTDSIASQDSDGWFIKFYVPWCRHCKAVENAWKELGAEMKDKLNIGEVNCEIEKRLCKELHVTAYPSLIFFKQGERIDYNGMRGIGDLVKFASQAMGAGIHEVDLERFDLFARKDQVVFVYFYDAATTSEDFAALQRTALSLIGHAPLLRTNDSALINRFRVPSFPSLAVIRENKPLFYSALSPRDMRDHKRLFDWMKSVWLPLLPELSTDNVHQVLYKRLVALAIFDRTLPSFENLREQMRNVAIEWNDICAKEDQAEKQALRDKKAELIKHALDKGDKKAADRFKQQIVQIKEKTNVGFAWVDGVFWNKWLQNVYGVDVRETGPQFIINQQDEKLFWDTTLTNEPITTPEEIIPVLQTILASPFKIRPKSLRGRFEAVGFFLRDTFSDKRFWIMGLFGVVVSVISQVIRRRRRYLHRMTPKLPSPSSVTMNDRVSAMEQGYVPRYNASVGSGKND